MQNNRLLTLVIVSTLLILFYIQKNYHVTLVSTSLPNNSSVKVAGKSNIPPKTELVSCPTPDASAAAKQLLHTYFGDLNDSAWRDRTPTYAPTYQELHALIFGASTPNIYKAWPNHFQKKLDESYPHSYLLQPVLHHNLKQIDIPITFVVEAGSFMGKSAVTIVHTLLDNKPWSKSVLLCIDTWLGGLEHWTNPDFRSMMGVAYGRPIVYEQFIANIIGKNFTDYVIPFSTTSLIGARFLYRNKLYPQVVYLDSAHLKGETYIEIQLYWHLLQTGGMLVGDDWGWLSVRSDILLFAEQNNVNVTVSDNTWFMKKRASS